MEETLSNDSKIKKMLKSTWDFLSDTFLSTIVVIGVVILIRFILVSPFEVNGGSMLDTLHDGDYIIVDKISYRFKDPERGDIIVLVPPTDTDTYYVKRIIGLPGEEVEFSNGQVLIHNDRYPAGLKLDEPYLNEDNEKTYLPNRIDRTIEVPSNQYFVMGDNRGGSNDSRQWGTLHSRNIEGRALIIVLPLRDFGLTQEVDYGMEE
ncbi:MAG: signal peptidase I [Candidatus Gracilibacteria bacterium]|nr:signal peptidase I [Candidatus Gracilibacteria bacterium]